MIELQDFHFLRPLWLLALPLVLIFVWLIWQQNRLDDSPWRKLCDGWLLKQLLVDRQHAPRLLPSMLFLLGTCLIIIAIAGPSWSKITQPAHRNLASRTIVIDLSLSMYAQDIGPSRLERARSAVAELLQQETQHQTGLVVFAGDAYVVAPLTFDRNTLLSMLEILDPKLMPLQGSRPDLGMEAAAELMEQAGAGEGEIILICDGFKGDRVMKTAEDLRDAGYTTAVAAIGSAQGAPVPLRTGGNLIDLAGDMVRAKTDLQALAALAEAGGGRFVSLNRSHTRLDQLSAEPASETATAQQTESRLTETWQDQGPWFALALLPLAALAFRRGWLLVLLLSCTLNPLARDASAWEWADFWLRPDQQAARSLAQGKPAPLLETATDPAWRGSALYRSGDYLEAVRAFAELDNVESHYNRGNALAKAGELQAALDAYDAALEHNAAHVDALHNRILVMALLREQQRQQQSRPNNVRGEIDAIPSEQEGNNSAEQQNNTTQADQDDAGKQQEMQDDATQEEDFDQQNEQDSESTAEQLQLAGTGDSNEGATAEQTEEPDNPELDQWLEQVADDPGEILRRKFEQLNRSRSRGRREAFGDAW